MYNNATYLSDSKLPELSDGSPLRKVQEQLPTQLPQVLRGLHATKNQNKEEKNTSTEKEHLSNTAVAETEEPGTSSTFLSAHNPGLASFVC